jgi:hypothetical protein
METDEERSDTQEVPINRDFPGCGGIAGDNRNGISSAVPLVRGMVIGQGRRASPRRGAG